jgi:small subunit ribosomal protein S1
MVRAKVKDVDIEKERISLSIKDAANDPYSGAEYRKGQIITVEIAEITSGGVEVVFGEDNSMRAFIRKSDLSRDRSEQRPDRFAMGDRIDAMVTQFERGARRVSLSVKALEMAEEKEAIAQFGSSDSGASLGDILGAALKKSETAGS